MFDVQLDEGGYCVEEGRERRGVICHVSHPGEEKMHFSQRMGRL